jgi:hypothetical protein
MKNHNVKGVSEMRTLTTVLLTSLFAVQAGAAYINRVDENGDVINGPIYFYVPDRDGPNNCRVSELGYIYFSDKFYINCFDTGLGLVNTVGIATYYAPLGIDDVNNKVISADTICIFSSTLTLEGQYEVLANVGWLTVDSYESTIWYTGVNDAMELGLYKCDMSGNPIYGFPDTNESILSSVAPDGKFWTNTWQISGEGLNLRDRNGNILSTVTPGTFDGAGDMEMYFADGSLWAEASQVGGYPGVVTKIDSSGNIVYRNTTDFDRPYAIDVNQNDGSVWIADTYNYQLVHLDANGGELLRKDWDYVLVEVAVDQSDNTLIVVDDNIAVEITPSSLGRIKAGFAEGQ